MGVCLLTMHFVNSCTDSVKMSHALMSTFVLPFLQVSEMCAHPCVHVFSVRVRCVAEFVGLLPRGVFDLICSNISTTCISN